ncbi:MAG: hypothetical protein JJU07_10365 [Natronohydrobacter sp.]|nr:hypothetical protein [Natronohydrobacter sp.]
MLITNSLELLALKLDARASLLDANFDRFLHNRKGMCRFDRSSIQEGLISNLWQAWCMFCRYVIISSTKGALTQSGAYTTSSYLNNSEMEIAYIAKVLAQGSNLGTIKSLSGTYQEHTWGDLNKFTLVISGIKPSNEVNLLNSISVCTRLKHLQVCRNAAAHITKSTISDLNSARVSYSKTSFQHPVDMLFWIDPVTSDFLWKSWVDEVKTAASIAVQ